MDYPKMLYRADEQRIVEDAAEHEHAKADGWLTFDQRFRDPLDHDGDGRKGGSRKKAR